MENTYEVTVSIGNAGSTKIEHHNITFETEALNKTAAGLITKNKLRDLGVSEISLTRITTLKKTDFQEICLSDCIVYSLKDFKIGLELFEDALCSGGAYFGKKIDDNFHIQSGSGLAPFSDPEDWPDWASCIVWYPN